MTEQELRTISALQDKVMTALEECKAARDALRHAEFTLRSKETTLNEVWQQYDDLRLRETILPFNPAENYVMDIGQDKPSFRIT